MSGANWSRLEEDIQSTALQWINEFIAIAPDIVMAFTPQIITSVLPSLAHEVSSIRNIATETNRNLQKLVLQNPVSKARSDDRNWSSQDDPFDYQKTVSELRLQFLNENEETRVASLEWLLMLHKKAPSKVRHVAKEKDVYACALLIIFTALDPGIRRRYLPSFTKDAIGFI
jgi:vacuole morphology and inheritance protein 14